MPPKAHHLSSDWLARLIEIRLAIVHEIRQHPDFSQSDPTWILSWAVSVHDADAQTIDARTDNLRTFFLTASSYGIKNARGILDELLAADDHLRACCQTAWGLARAIDLHVSDSSVGVTGGEDEEGVKTAVSRMVASLYQEDFKCGIFVRLYNFDTDCLPLAIPSINAEIVKLTAQEIAELLGESTPYTSLHDAGTGTCFLRFLSSDSSNEGQAFEAAWMKAHDLLKVMRYIRYGPIDLDYGAIYYAPIWVTWIKRHGIRFWGQPRRDRQSQFYTLTRDELQKLYTFGLAYKKLQAIIGDPKPGTLRLANSLAGNYYEGHYRRREDERDQKLIDLVIALETLFSPRKEGELRFRIAQRAAILLGKDAEERKSLMKFFKTVYDARSQIVHSGISAFRPPELPKGLAKGLTTLTDEQLVLLGDYLRQATLKILTLVWRGKEEREEVNSLLDTAALDETTRLQIFKESDFELALEELLRAP